MEFDWQYYIHKNDDLAKYPTMRNREAATNHFYEVGQNQQRKNYREFYPEWYVYLNHYDDLKAALPETKEAAIGHFQTHGQGEGRVWQRVYKVSRQQVDMSRVNTTVSTSGHLAHHIIRNIVMSMIAIQNNLPFTYGHYDECAALGLAPLLYTEGTVVYDETIVLSDTIVDAIFSYPLFYNTFISGRNVFINQVDCDPLETIMDGVGLVDARTNVTPVHIREAIMSIKDEIMEANPNRDRYGANNEVFIHMCLRSPKSLKGHELEYYDTTISKLRFDKAYISSDFIDHEICQQLIKKYKLTVYDANDVTTIQFASTCRDVVVSLDSKSWVIGMTSFSSNVFCPRNNDDSFFMFDEFIKV